MIRRLFFYCFVALVLGYLTNYYFLYHLDPDAKFFAKLDETSQEWEKGLRKEYPNIFVLVGGSSSRSSIDSQLLLDEYQIPLVNAASGAGHGIATHVVLADRFLKKGDTLILAEETVMLHKKGHLYNDAGRMFSMKQRGWESLKSPYLDWRWDNYHSLLSVNSVALSSYIFKSLTRPSEEMYRYNKWANIHPSGWMEVTLVVPEQYYSYLDKHVKTLHFWTLTEDVVTFYKQIAKDMKARGVHVIAMLPRQITPDPKMRAALLWMALQIHDLGIPVLEDPKCGVITDLTQLADTPNHLNKAGAIENTCQLGESLKEQRFWTREKLIVALKQMGWDENGHRITS